MGATYYGQVKWKCREDCRMSGCPGHEATLAAKHGSYYLRGIDGEQTEIYGDINLINAISWTLWRYRGLVEETK